ncbi:MAG: dihydroorotase [Myxococcota bacterium]|nr:dihydroorotase [Myxococcota bacterium]
MKTIYVGGKVLCPGSGQDELLDLLVEDEEIVAVGGFDPDGVDAERVECGGLVIAPGFVDLEAQLCDPGFTWREDLVSGSQAAARGGFTTVLASPRTDPVLDDPALVREVIDRGREMACVDVLVAAALTTGLGGEDIAEVGLLVEAGASALSNCDVHIRDTTVLRNALLYARPFGKTVMLRVGDPWLDKSGVVNEGEVSTGMGLRGISDANEEIGLSRLVALARVTGASIHATGISTAKGVQVLRRAREEGLGISGSTGASYLLLNQEDVLESGYNTAYKLSPPLRTEVDRQALVEAVRDDVLTAVTSQHVPWTRVEKELEFEQAEAGAAGLETALSATMAALDDLSAAVRALSTGPAELLGLNNALQAGAVANFVLLDPSASVSVNSAEFASKSKSSPLDGRVLPVEVKATVNRGKAVHTR